MVASPVPSRAEEIRQEMSAAQVLAVIPARYASVRLPGKPLVVIAGQPMIARVWERTRQARRVTRVIVATDD